MIKYLLAMTACLATLWCAILIVGCSGLCVSEGQRPTTPLAEIHGSTDRITLKCSGESVGEAVARIFAGRCEVLVDARFGETNVHTLVTNRSRLDIAASIVDQANLSVSPSRKVIYIGCKEDAKRARESMRLLARARFEERDYRRCAYYGPFHIGDAGQAPKWMSGEPVTIRVAEPDARGNVQGCRLRGRTTICDYYWSVVALSSTRLIVEEGKLVLVPAEAVRMADTSATNSWAKTYWQSEK